MQSIIICPKLRRVEVFPWLADQARFPYRLLIACCTDIALSPKRHSASKLSGKPASGISAEKLHHHQNLLLSPFYPTPFSHMADEDLSDEQVRQLLKDAEQRLRSKWAGSKTSLSLQNRYSRPISYMNPLKFADRLTDSILHQYSSACIREKD